MNEPIDAFTDHELTAEVRRRGFTVTEKPGPIGWRYILEHLEGDAWADAGAFLMSTEPLDPDEQCARWCHSAALEAGIYRCAVYQGAELVGSSRPRELA